MTSSISEEQQCHTASEEWLCADTPSFLIVTSSCVCKPKYSRNYRLCAHRGQSLLLFLGLPTARLLVAHLGYKHARTSEQGS